MPLNRVYPLPIAFERFIVLLPSIFFCFLNALNLWLPDTQSVSSDTKLLGAGVADPARPKLISESMLDRYVKAAA